MKLLSSYVVVVIMKIGIFGSRDNNRRILVKWRETFSVKIFDLTSISSPPFHKHTYGFGGVRNSINDKRIWSALQLSRYITPFTFVFIYHNSGTRDVFGIRLCVIIHSSA